MPDPKQATITDPTEVADTAQNGRKILREEAKKVRQEANRKKSYLHIPTKDFPAGSEYDLRRYYQEPQRTLSELTTVDGFTPRADHSVDLLTLAGSHPPPNVARNVDAKHVHSARSGTGTMH